MKKHIDVNETLEVISRNFGELSPEANLIAHVLIQAIRDMDMLFLRGQTAGIIMKHMGLDQTELIEGLKERTTNTRHGFFNRKIQAKNMDVDDSNEHNLGV